MLERAQSYRMPAGASALYGLAVGRRLQMHLWEA